MNTSLHPETPELEPPLDSAVWAIVGEHIPTEALDRIKQRAKSLALPKNSAAESDVSLNSHINEATLSKPATPSTTDNRPQSTRSRRGLKIGAWLTLAASVIAVAVTSMMNPSLSMAQVVSNTLAQRWVHGTVTWYVAASPQNADAADNKQENAKSSLVTETWISASHGILVARLPDRIVFEDRPANVFVNYEIGSTTAIQTLPVSQEMQPLDQNQSLLNRLQSLQAGGQSEHGFVVKDVHESKTTVEGQSILEYSFRLEQPGNPTNSRDIKLTMNEKRQLVETLEETYHDGSRSVTRFDYPASGPTDLQAAGIPADVRLVDRRASTDVRQLESAWSKARAEFDAYDAVFVQVPDGLKHSVFTGLNADIKRVRRDGNRYRVDTLLRPMPGVEPPTDDTNMDEWWKANRDQFWSVPELICDGSTVTYYSMVDGRLRKDIPPNLEVKVRNQHPVRGSGVDRPVAWPHLMPEYSCRPHLWMADVKRLFEYSPTPDDGPEESVRLIVTKPDETMTPERHRYWLDPSKGFCVREVVQPVFQPRSSDVAYINSEEAFDFKQSPSGFWYPTRVERMTSEASRLQIRTFHVDFVTNLDSALFVPLDLKTNG